MGNDDDWEENTESMDPEDLAAAMPGHHVRTAEQEASDPYVETMISEPVGLVATALTERRPARKAQAHRSVRVLLVWEPDRAWAVELTRDTYAIGRSISNDVRLRDRRVSRHHALLFEEGGRWVYRQGKAANISYVALANDIRSHSSSQVELQARGLQDGDHGVLSVGDGVILARGTWIELSDEVPPGSTLEAPTFVRDEHAWPFPIAHYDRLERSHTENAAKLTTLYAGLERALAYSAILQWAWLKRVEPAAADEAVQGLSLTAGKPLSLGAWLQVARRMAEHVERAAPSSDSPFHWISSLGEALQRNGVVTPEFRVIDEEVPQRNTAMHHGARTDADAIRLLNSARTSWSTVKRMLIPVRATRLVSLANIVFLRGKTSSAIRYGLRLHQGSNAPFPLFETELEERLEQPWCYVLVGDFDALCLGPWVWCEHTDTGHPDVFVAETLLAEKGRVRGRGVASARPSKQIAGT